MATYKQVEVLGGGDARQEWGRIVSVGGRTIPPRPSFAAPATPGIFGYPWDTPHDFQLSYLMRLYRGACRATLGIEPKVLIPPKKQNREFLDTVIPALHDYPDVYRWALFEVARIGAVLSRAFPTLKQVYSVKSMAKHYPAMKAASQSLCPIAVPQPYEVTHLVETWDQMKADMLEFRPRTAAEIETYVDRYFPGRKYDRMHAEALFAVRRETCAAAKAASEGEVYWKL